MYWYVMPCVHYLQEINSHREITVIRFYCHIHMWSGTKLWPHGESLEARDLRRNLFLSTGKFQEIKSRAFTRERGRARTTEWRTPEGTHIVQKSIFFPKIALKYLLLILYFHRRGQERFMGIVSDIIAMCLAYLFSCYRKFSSELPRVCLWKFL